MKEGDFSARARIGKQGAVRVAFGTVSTTRNIAHPMAMRVGRA